MKAWYILVLVIPAAVWWFYGSEDVEPVDIDVPATTVYRSSISKVVNATGVIKPMTGAEVKVGSRLSGVVDKLYVDVGDTVKQGDLLAELDDGEFETRIAEVEARILQLQAEVEYSRSQLDRASKLTIITESEIDNVKRNVAVNEALYAQAVAGLETIETQHSYTRVIAPISGTISSVSTYQGETIAASFAAPTFLTIVDLRRLEIQAYVDETDIGQVKLDQEISFNVDTFPEAGFSGRVRTIYPKAEIVNNVVNYVVIIDIDVVPGYLLRPEMTAHVRFVIDKKENTFSVPRKALLRENGNNLLIVAGADGWIKRPVTLGIINSSEIEITRGLNEGDVLITDKQVWLDYLTDKSAKE